MSKFLVSTVWGRKKTHHHQAVALRGEGGAMKLQSLNVGSESVAQICAHPRRPVLYAVTFSRTSDALWVLSPREGQFTTTQRVALTPQDSRKFFLSVDAARNMLYVVSSGGSLYEVALLPDGSLAKRAPKRTVYADTYLDPDVGFSFSPNRNRMLFAYIGGFSDTNRGGFAALERAASGELRSVPVVHPLKRPLFWEMGNKGALQLSDQWGVIALRSGGISLAQWRRDRVQLLDALFTDKHFFGLFPAPSFPQYFVAQFADAYGFAIFRVKKLAPQPVVEVASEWSHSFFVWGNGAFDPDTLAFY